MKTKNLADENFRKLADLFPDVVTETKNAEGRVVRAIDKDKLMQAINGFVVDDSQERYQFTWPDKRKAIVLANTPINKTLRLQKEKSVGRDGTPGGTDSENIYIEGDNLDALKLLRETYLGKIQAIYIDPPYNTGHDLIYYDNFKQGLESYRDSNGDKDEYGNRLVQNLESNGRYHTDWLNMIYPRLRLAKDLLSNDGLIFISVDDYELDNILKVCNEIFGRENFINCFVWKRNSSGKTEKDKFTVNSEYVLLYAKTNNYHLNDAYKPLAASSEKMYSKDDHDGRGKYATVSLQKPSNPGPETTYDYIDNNGKVWPCPPKGWRMTYDKVKALENDNRLYFEGKNLRVKDYWNERDNEGKRIDTLWTDLPENTTGSKQLENLFGTPEIFSNPKPFELIKRCLEIADKEAIVLDFFSGSATSAQAVFKANTENLHQRKFILVQLPEILKTNSKAYESGFKNICDLGEERIRRAGKKIKEETHADIDYGFRCFTIDSSNMNDVYYAPTGYSQEGLDLFADNIKSDRTPEDLLVQVMLELGILLSSKVEKLTIAGKQVFSVMDGYLLACFDPQVNEEVITEMAKRKPRYAVLRDDGMASDSVAANFDQIFMTYSPETQRKVL